MTTLPFDSTAVELFNDRAAAASSAFEVNESEQQAVRAICRRLDGMPLAIELAAAQMRAMTATELVGRLDQRFRVLGAGRSAPSDRHALLQTALDWSLDLLEEEERLFFSRVSIFAGAFDVEAAHAVAGLDGSMGLMSSPLWISLMHLLTNHW